MDQDADHVPVQIPERASMDPVHANAEEFVPSAVYPVVVGTPGASAAFLRAFLGGGSDTGDGQNIIVTLAPSSAVGNMAMSLGFGQCQVRFVAPGSPRGRNSDIEAAVPTTSAKIVPAAAKTKRQSSLR